MRFTLSVTHCAFTWPRAPNDRYRVKIYVTYAEQEHNLGTGHQRFAPTDASPIRTTGGSWRHVVDIDRRTGDPTVEVRAVLSKWDTTTELEEVIHHWSSRLFFDTVDIHGDKLSIRVHQDAPRHNPPTVVYTRRSGPQFAEPQIASAPRVALYLHLDPIMPWAARTRVVLPAWTQAPGSTRYGHPRETPPCALNPSVVPSWSEEGPPPPSWLNRWQARIHLTRIYARGAYHPFDLTWAHETISGSPEFVVQEPRRGVSAVAYARGEGEGRITVSRRGGPPLARLRVLARPPVTLNTRLIVMMPQNASQFPNEAAAMRGVTERHFNREIDVANRFLQQVAIKLGHATRSVRTGLSIGVNPDFLDERVSDLAEADTITFVVLHSGIDASGGQILPGSTLGKACGIPRTRAPLTQPPALLTQEMPCFTGNVAGFVDSGTPSTSLVPPTGVAPDGAAVPQRLAVIVGDDNAIPVVFLYLQVEGANGLNTGVSGSTIAHEVGHVLNLAHRGSDRMPFLGTQNPMMPSAESTDANDLDIAQAKIIWNSPLLSQ